MSPRGRQERLNSNSNLYQSPTFNDYSENNPRKDSNEYYPDLVYNKNMVGTETADALVLDHK